MYLGKTNTDLAYRNGARTLKVNKGVGFCIRIGLPTDNELFAVPADHNTRPIDYECPIYHQQFLDLGLPEDIVAPVGAEPDPNQQKDPNYSCSGVKVRLHYILAKRQIDKLKVRITFYTLPQGYTPGSKSQFIFFPNTSDKLIMASKSAKKELMFQVPKGSVVGYNNTTGEMGPVMDI